MEYLYKYGYYKTDVKIAYRNKTEASHRSFFPSRGKKHGVFFTAAKKAARGGLGTRLLKMPAETKQNTVGDVIPMSIVIRYMIF